MREFMYRCVYSCQKVQILKKKDERGVMEMLSRELDLESR
jgi:hypothetical protein